MATPPPTTLATPNPPAPTGPPRGHETGGGGILAADWVVRLVIAVTLLCTLVMVSLIYYRWLTVQEPTATIIISGDSSLAGAQIILTPSPAGPVVPALNESDDYSTPVHLQPGNYHLTVKLNDQTIFNSAIEADRLKTPDIALPTLLIVTGDSSMDGADLILTDSNGKRLDAEEFDSQNGYTSKWRVYPGTYHLTAIRNGITLYDKDVAIGIHQPLTIDLTQPPLGHH